MNNGSCTHISASAFSIPGCRSPAPLGGRYLGLVLDSLRHVARPRWVWCATSFFCSWRQSAARSRRIREISGLLGLDASRVAERPPVSARKSRWFMHRLLAVEVITVSCHLVVGTAKPIPSPLWFEEESVVSSSVLFSGRCFHNTRLFGLSAVERSNRSAR